jgi:hypothetical protein
MADDDFKPVAPKMAGLFQHAKGEYVAWTGGKPKRDWTSRRLSSQSLTPVFTF